MTDRRLVDGGVSAAVAPRITFLNELAVPAMKAPLRIASGPNDEIVITDPRAKMVHVLNANGSRRFSIDDVVRPLGCAVDGQGRIYVGDQRSGSIRIYASGGDFVGTLGRGKHEVKMPNELVWVPSNDVVYVVDSKASSVRAYATNGDFLYSFGSGGALQFPTGIVHDPGADHLLVVDHGGARIQEFDLEGTWITTFGDRGDGDAKLTRPQGIARDSSGRLYVADAFQGQIEVIDQAGWHLSRVGEYGFGAGQLALPMDVVVDSRNRLLVTSYRRGKVLVFSIDASSKPKPRGNGG